MKQIMYKTSCNIEAAAKVNNLSDYNSLTVRAYNNQLFYFI